MASSDPRVGALALARIPGIGARLWRRLSRAFGEPAEVLRADASAWKSLGMSVQIMEAVKRPPWSGAEADMRWLDGADNRFCLLLGTSDYPPRLDQISSPPVTLFVEGEVLSLYQDQIAMVGSRNPTAEGRRNAALFARGFAGCGFVVTSGLALGIDGDSHQGALSVGGQTIAVCAHGLDQIYPRRHCSLASTIVDHGALVSEFPPGTPIKPGHFPQRNRIISGLSLGVVVIEASQRSGSLITAYQALDQNRMIFALPSSIHNAMASGCHRLIREGAVLVRSAQDVLTELLPQRSQSPAGAVGSEPESDGLNLEPDARSVLRALEGGPASRDMLALRTGLTAATLSSILLLLELHSRVALTPGGYYSRI